MEEEWGDYKRYNIQSIDAAISDNLSFSWMFLPFLKAVLLAGRKCRSNTVAAGLLGHIAHISA
ncbi:MAG: hypothetical protein M9933_13085 [Chitinophagaceae bacterium]|nr:hypothetical protein [Chitinophagaceae bacterium]